MSTIRESLWLVITDGNRVRTMLGHAPRIDELRAISGAVRVVKVPHAAVSTALQLAGGDVSRLRLDEDGSVMVANAPRTPPRPARVPRHYGAPW